jgi:septal ring factor EnvC (AmiA/AmiB activator)
VDRKYIQNVHTNSIKTHFADKTEVIFRPQAVDHFSGRQTSTGYTALAADEYKKLLKESAVFKHFIDLKKLIVHDELPPDAQTPHEALVHTRKEVGKLNAALEAARAEKDGLQARLDEAEGKYKELLAAGGGEQLVKVEAALKEAQEKIQALTVENEGAKKAFNDLKNAYEALKAEYEKQPKKGK